MTGGLWPSPEWRRAPAVFAFFVLQMMNNGSPEFIFLADARGSTSNLKILVFDDDPLEH